MRGESLIGRQRRRIEVDVGRQWVGGKPGDYHFRFGIDVDSLTVNTPRRERSVAVVRYPPHVAIAPPWQGPVAGRGKLLTAAAAANVSDQGGWHNLLAVVASTKSHHLAEAGQVAEC